MNSSQTWGTHEAGTALLDSSNIPSTKPRHWRTAATALLRTLQRCPPRALLNVQNKIWDGDKIKAKARKDRLRFYRDTVGSDAVELACINNTLFEACTCQRTKSQTSFSPGPAYRVTDAFEDDDGRMHLVVCKDSGKDATLLRVPIELLLSKPGTSTFSDMETQL